MKKAIFVLLALTAASGMLFAQAAGGTTPQPAAQPSAQPTAQPTAQPAAIGAPDATKIGVDTAQQKLKEVSVDQFESAGFWTASMSNDEGLVTDRLFEGRPAGSAAEPLPDPRYVGVAPDVVNKYVLGVRADFYKRGFNEIDISSTRPIPIEGITKTISVWVAGRNYNHTLQIVLQDFFGNTYALTMGKLNFQGWKKLTVAIPPQNADGSSGIVQRNPHFNAHSGLKVVGFRILCDPNEAFGTYYIYFDDMRAVTDLFAEDSRDPDDMQDNW